jgi:hypothetical protein
MSRTDIGVLTIRAFAIYACFQALGYLGTGEMMTWVQADRLDSLAPMQATLSRLRFFIPAVSFASVGIVLFLSSRRLSRFILQPTSSISEPPASAFIIAQALFAAVGIDILLQAIPRLLDFPVLSWKFQHNLLGTLGDCGQIIVGFLLFLRPFWFTRFVTKNNTP